MMKKVLDYVKKYQMIQENDHIVAGVSGGADSVCLLFMLVKIREEIPFRLSVVHVNHMIREEAKEDASYVKQLCDKMNVPFYLREIPVKEWKKSFGLSEEEAGRKARYQAFEEILEQEGAKGNGKIAVAHHQNDRAETMLFHLFRGSGLTGLSGIRPVNGRIIRPLLCLSREEIEEWLCENQIAYCVDRTNQEDHYTRNRIRHYLLPFAEKEVCKGAVLHVNEAAEDLEAVEHFIERETEKAKRSCSKIDSSGEMIIDLPAYHMLDEYLKGRVLLSCIGELHAGRKDITRSHIRSIRELFLTEKNGELTLPYGIRVYKSYDQGMIKFQEDEQPPRICIELKLNESCYVKGLGQVILTKLSGENPENFPRKTYTKWFDYDKISTSILLRTREMGDYLTINSKMDRKSLQDYFVNEKVPKLERNTIYLLADGSHILWIPGYRISEYYKVTEETRQILQVQILKEEEKDG